MASFINLYGKSNRKNEVETYPAILKTKDMKKWRKPGGVRAFLYIHRKILVAVLIFFLLLLTIISARSNKTTKKSNLVTNTEQGFQKLVIPEREQAFFALKTQKVRKFGVLPQETFVLTTQKPVSKSFIESNINTSRKLTVKEISDTEFHLKPASLLDLEEAIVIQLATKDKEVGGYTLDRNYSWSFQSQRKFQVVSTIPGDKNISTPLNAGIEIVFSQDGFNDPKTHIQIDPPIEFETKTVDETFVIIPQQQLSPETTYTVTLTKGLSLADRNDKINENYIFSFQTQPLPSPTEANPQLSLKDTFVQTSPSEPLSIKVNTSGWSNDTTVETFVYKFDGPDDFVTTRSEYDKIRFSWKQYYPNQHNYSDSLAKVLSVQVSVQDQDNVKYVKLPKTLPPGYYLVEFKIGDKLISNQAWYQSTDLSGYLSLGKEQTIAWANNTQTKGPSSGAIIRSITTGGTWITDSDGIAKFPTSDAYFNDDPHYFEFRDQANNSLVIPLNPQRELPGPGKSISTDYWSYLYNEKVFYAPTDTVNFWGVIKNRDTNIAPISQLELRSPKGDVLYSQAITPNSDGSFLGSILLDETPAGWYSIVLLVNEVEIKSVHFSIREYVKPDMKIEISASKKAIFTGEEVIFTTNTSFFDKTPGAHINLNIHESRTGEKQQSTTDSSGQIIYPYTPQYDNPRYYPRYEGISASPALTQESVVEGNGSVKVYGSKLMMTTERKQDGNKASLKATVNVVDLSGINAGITNDPKGNVVREQEVKLSVTESWTERTETGTYYNFVEKTTFPKYKYTRKEAQITNKTLTTNEFGEVSYDFDMKDNRSYTTNLIITDKDNHSSEKNLYFYSSSWTGGRNSRNNDIQLDLGGGRETNVFSEGEKVELKLTQGNDDYSGKDGYRYLFTKAQRGNQDSIVTNEPKYSYLFDSSSIPNEFVSAVIFNGNHYIKANSNCRNGWKCDGFYYGYGYGYGYNTYKGIAIVYDSDDSKLEIDITPSEVKYEPGDEATIKVSVTKDGQPVNQASVNLVMIDEALAAIGGARKPDILNKIYTTIPHQVYYVYTSHNPVLPDTSGAERGGGGGDRDLFKDTAIFAQIRTDESGIATFTFELPDNITTWLTYAQSITNNLEAGQNETRVVVTKDFFVTSKFPKSILSGDKAYVSVNSFGTSLIQNDKINFTILFSDNVREIANLSQQGSSFTEISTPFPDVDAGIYKITSRGEINGKRDGVILPVNIIESRVNQNYQIQHLLENESSLNKLIPETYLDKEPIKLLISDKGKGKFFSTLRNYCYRSSSNRLERKIASERSHQILSEKFDYSRCINNPDDLIVFQNADGGLGQVKWGGSNLETTLWATLTSPEKFDKDLLKKYFNEHLSLSNSSISQKTYAAWGLSILGESKLLSLQSMISKAHIYEQKVYLALALADLGDIETARDIYLNILADYGYAAKPYIRIDSEQDRGNTPEDFVVDTSVALLLGELVEKKYNEDLYSYVVDYKNNLDNYIIDLSEMAYIETEISKLPDTDTKYVLTTASGQKTEKLNKGRSLSYDLGPSDVSSFSFDLIEGKAELTAQYSIGINELKNKEKDKRLSITRRIEKAKPDGKKDIHPGDIMKITLDLDLEYSSAPRGSYEVKDILPSGLTYLSNPTTFGLSRSGYVKSIDDKTLTFHVYNSYYRNSIQKIRPIIYYARASSVGTYRAEPAVFQSLRDLTILNWTDDAIVTIEASTNQ